MPHEGCLTTENVIKPAYMLNVPVVVAEGSAKNEKSFIEISAPNVICEAVNNNLDKMVNNIYYDAGVSGLLFGGNSNSALDPSVKNDIGFMTLLTNKYEIFVENLINRIISSNAVRFKYSILPVTRFNDDKYADLTFKLATSGYSYILPALACGISQKDLVCLKDLENSLLKLGEKLIPLQSAFTQTDNPGAGAPKKEEEEKKPQTKENEKSLDKQGVIGNENN